VERNSLVVWSAARTVRQTSERCASVTYATPTPFASLEGKAAVVTGATRGLGRAIAHMLDEVGVRTIVVGRDARQGERAAGELSNGVFVAVDLEDDDASDRIVAACVDHFGAIDILVNNAAIYPAMPIGTMSAPAVERMFKVNTVTPILLMQAAAQAMIAGPGGGSIVNVISTSAFRPVPNQAVYGSAKAALALATRAFAAELAPRGVRVNAISPGAMDHGDGGRAAALGLDEKQYADLVGLLISRIPLGRKAASREVAACALFLCSSLASIVTGLILHCDGGETI
jgi:NAD(P)-dependent dehydrogenase (short-subunit alcohol dehydrogenase family)